MTIKHNGQGVVYTSDSCSKNIAAIIINASAL